MILHGGISAHPGHLDTSDSHPGMDNLETLPMDLGEASLVPVEVEKVPPASNGNQTPLPSIIHKKTLILGEEEESGGGTADENPVDDQVGVSNGCG